MWSELKLRKSSTSEDAVVQFRFHSFQATLQIRILVRDFGERRSAGCMSELVEKSDDEELKQVFKSVEPVVQEW